MAMEAPASGTKEWKSETETELKCLRGCKSKRRHNMMEMSTSYTPIANKYHCQEKHGEHGL